MHVSSNTSSSSSCFNSVGREKFVVFINMYREAVTLMGCANTPTPKSKDAVTNERLPCIEIKSFVHAAPGADKSESSPAWGRAGQLTGPSLGSLPPPAARGKSRRKSPCQAHLRYCGIGTSSESIRRPCQGPRRCRRTKLAPRPSLPEATAQNSRGEATVGSSVVENHPEHAAAKDESPIARLFGQEKKLGDATPISSFPPHRFVGRWLHNM